MQPILSNPLTTSTTRASRRGGAINYADPGSGDDIPDAGALDSDDSDFQASGGTRTAIRQQTTRRMGAGMNVFHAGSGVSTPQPLAQPVRSEKVEQKPEKAELDQSYLGMVPPTRFIKQKPIAPTVHEYP
jgi:chromatin structure-remodeling complex subunit SFH1